METINGIDIVGRNVDSHTTGQQNQEFKFQCPQATPTYAYCKNLASHNMCRAQKSPSWGSINSHEFIRIIVQSKLSMILWATQLAVKKISPNKSIQLLNDRAHPHSTHTVEIDIACQRSQPVVGPANVSNKFRVRAHQLKLDMFLERGSWIGLLH